MAEPSRRATFVAILFFSLVILVPFSSISFQSDSLNQSSESRIKSTLVGDTEIVEIDNYPNGFSDDFRLSIPNGDALDLLEFDLMPKVDLSFDSHEWNSISDWTSSSSDYENVDYNLTGLRINSPPPTWDFESSNHGWNLDANGGWAWGVDSAGAHGGSKAIYTYSGQYPNQMSTTYYATSPSVDCSSCSGGWNVNFWKQLGVESSSWDHAYFQVKGVNGWVTIWENSGYVSDSTYIFQSYRVDSYIAGNSDFRIRFGLGPTDFSVTYDGWNIDDISITPVSGSGLGAAKVEGSGDANWTSPEIGEGKYHNVRTGPYGFLNILAETPIDTGIDWSIIDANSQIPILGYENRKEFFADLGRIDWEKHSSIKIKVHLWSDAAESPELKSIILGNVWNFGFNKEPTELGWNGNVNLVNGKYEGNGDLIMPDVHSIRPILSMEIDVSVSGVGQLQVSYGFGNWTNVSNSDIIVFDKPSKYVQLRWLSDSGTWVFDSIELQFNTGLLPLSPSIDIGKDGKDEWNLSRSEIGFWGSQDRWSDGSISQLITLSSGSPKYVDFWIPSNLVGGFCMDLTPESNEIVELNLDLRVGSQVISDIEISNHFGIFRFCLNETEVQNLNENTSLNSAVWSTIGQSFISAKIKMTGVAQRVQISALDIPYDPIIEFRESYDSSLIKIINNFLPDSIVSTGSYLIPIPIYSDVKSSFLVNLIDQHSTSGLITEGSVLVNSTLPLVSSEIWMDLESRHSVSFGTIKSIEYDIISKFNEINMVFDVDGMDSFISGNSELIEFDNDIFHYDEQNNENISKLRFRTSPFWDDDYDLQIQIRLIRTDGFKSIPEKIFIGSNSAKSIENDVEIKSWSILNDLGDEIPENMPYLKSGSNISINVELGFENFSSTEYFPKSGDLEVFVLENGYEIGRSDLLTDGKVNFVRSIPFGPGNLTYEVKLNTTNSQQDATKILVNRTFTADSLAPQLISSTINRYDHRSPSSNQILAFEVFDRPVLPENLKINLWRDWIDDFNNDGLPSLDEYWSNNMFSPANLSSSSGTYTYVLDDSNAPIGSFVYGYVTGSDSAGNLLVGGGGGELGEELFIYQVRKDSLPQILTENISWQNSGLMWINPGVQYDLSLPFNELNGISDVELVIFNLAEQNGVSDLSIIWNNTDSSCKSNGDYLDIISCNIYSRSSQFGPFNSELEFKISFKFKWTYDAEESLVHEPSIEIKERSGYSSMVTLPQLRWRYSNQIIIESETLEFNSERGTKIGNSVYVLPNSLLSLDGIISFSRTGNPVLTRMNVEIGIGFTKENNFTNNGEFNFELTSPLAPGNYPLSLDIIETNFGIFDNNNLAAIWIVVDNQAPIIDQISSPRSEISLSREEISELLIDLSIKETIMLLDETVKIHWSISEVGESASDFLIADVIEPLNIGEPIGGRYSVSLKLSLIDAMDSLSPDKEYNFNIWVEGIDAAGNIISVDENSESSPLESWIILPYQPMLVLSDITYSKYGGINLDDPIKVVISVENVGNSNAETNLTILVKNSKGESVIAREPINVETGSRSSIAIDWAPGVIGTQWIEVRWNDQYLGEGSLISVNEVENTIFSSIESSGPVFATVFVLLVIIITVLFIVFNSDDEYYEDFEDFSEEDEFVDSNNIISKQIPPLPQNNNLMPNLSPEKITNQNNVRQWTDEKGYTWRIEGDSPAKWWDGNSWKEV